LLEEENYINLYNKDSIYAFTLIIYLFYIYIYLLYMYLSYKKLKF